MSISSQDPLIASRAKYDVAIIGAGILGTTLAHGLATSGRTVILFERDLSEPDRIVGELLQPGGCMALRKLGADSTLEGMDAVPVDGYQVFWGPSSVKIPYPTETVKMAWSNGSPNLLQQGRSFHHGKFIQNLRRLAATAPGVTIVEATVNDLIKNESTGVIQGVSATPKGTPASSTAEPINYYAKLTFVADGCFSKFRRELLPSHVKPTVKSNFVGIVLEDASLPAPKHGHVILRHADAPTSTSLQITVGPVLVYQLASRETRMLCDIRGPKVPSSSNGELAEFLRTNVTPSLPPSIVPSFNKALDKSLGPNKEYRLRSMPNSFLAPYPQGRLSDGVILAGDALNMRHPLTGGGMTVAFNDVVILTQLFGGGKPVGTLGANENPIDLENTGMVGECLEEWHWSRKGVASCINILAMALYALFAAEDPNLEVLKMGCFKYFERGGACISEPVSLLSAITPSPMLLTYHFFAVAFYSMGLLYSTPRSVDGVKRLPSLFEYPLITIRCFGVLWTACLVFVPFMWSEWQM